MTSFGTRLDGLSRRTALAGACALVLGTATGCVARARRGAGDTAAASTVTTVDSGSFVSARRRGARIGWTVVRPAAGGDALPVVLVLHGMGERNSSMVDALGYDRVLATVIGSGTPPFALAAADGEDRFWHARADGDDPQAMLTDEFLPLLARQGLRTDVIGLTGWSMGGYGALLLATVLGPDRIAGVAVGSPALFRSPAEALEAVPQAFDGEADYRRNDVTGRIHRFEGIPLRVECGDADPLADASRRFASRVSPRPAGGIEPGDHTPEFWRRIAPAQMRMLGATLARRAPG